MSGTCGQPTTGSYKQLTLPSFSVSKSPVPTLSEKVAEKLKQLIDASGSMEYVMTWKRHTTPSGRVIYRLRASARRTSGSGCSGWQSPIAGDSKSVKYRRDQGAKGRERPTNEGCLVGWPTARAEDSKSTGAHRGIADTLTSAARLTGWTTPTAHDVSPRGKNQKAKHGTKHGCADLNADVMLTGWPTPTARDRKNGKASQDTMDRNSRPLNKQVVQGLTGWQTPTKQDNCAVGPAEMEAIENWVEGTLPQTSIQRLRTQVHLGATLPSSSAATGKPAASLSLNPAFSRWLLGYPAAWDQASPGWLEWQKLQDAIASGG